MKFITYFCLIYFPSRYYTQVVYDGANVSSAGCISPSGQYH